MDEQSAGAQELKDFRDSGKKLFAGACDFLWAATDLAQLPPIAVPEIAFAGRSNVGKSSLINALTNRKTLARTSNTPGRTQALNFFALGPSADAPRLRLVDMPGYGYAAASKEKIAAWTSLMTSFLRGRAALVRVYVLVDGRHGIKEVDREMMDLLDKSATSYQVVLTKRDEVKKRDQDAMLEKTREALSRRPAAHPHVLFLSSHTGENVTDLRAAIAQLMSERGA